jgi:hypothetical protein
MPPVVADRSTPAFWKLSTMRALPVRLTSPAAFSGTAACAVTSVELPSSTLTAPVFEFHVTWARSFTVNARTPSTYSEYPAGACG